jgi:4-hydroxybenzoate polyprenyltransferase
MTLIRRILGIIFFGVLIRDVVRATLLLLLGAILAEQSPDMLHLTLAYLSVIAVSVFANIENDIADVELDREVKAYRPIPMGKYTIEEARRASLLFVIASLVMSGATILLSRKIILGMILFALPPATYLYSSPPVRLKSRGWFGVITLTCIYLSPLLVGYVGAGGGAQNASILVLLLLAFFVATGAKDFEDVEVDGSFGVQTPPVMYGVAETASRLTLVAILLSGSAAALMFAYLLEGHVPQGLYCLALIPSALTFLARLRRYVRTGQRADLMRLVKGNLWTIFVWPTAAGIGIFVASAILS